MRRAAAPAPRGRRGSRGLGRFFFRLALFARDGALRIVALLALGDAGGIEEAHHAVGRLRTLGHPGLDLVEIELETLGLVLRQQRIEIAKALDEAAIAWRAAVGDDDMIKRPLLGSGAGHTDYNGHCLFLLLIKFRISRGLKRGL